MRIIATGVAVTSVSLATAMMLSTGLPLVQAEQQAGSHDRSAQPLSFPTPPPITGFLFVVTSTGDGDNTGSGAVCDDGTGNCTLRAAIEVANANVGDDGIRFNIPTTDPGFDGASWIIQLTKPLPDISTNIAIVGPGPDKLLVERGTGGDYRIFNVTTPGTASFSGLNIFGGLLDDDNGAGIQNFNNGTVNVTNCTITSNFAFHQVVNNSFHPRFGGGIYNKGTGTVNITGSTFSGNSASDGGGAIRSENGPLTITNSTFINNSTIDGSGGGILNAGGACTVTNSTLNNNSANGNQEGGGGGIQNISGTLTVTNCTVSHNFAASNNSTFFGGGGISNESTLNLVNSTVSDNFAFADGGGIRNASTSGIPAVATVSNCTVSGNSVISGNGFGGGIFNRNGSMINVKGTIIALNSANSGPDVIGSFTSGGFNLIGNPSPSTGFTAPTDKTGSFNAPLDPGLSPAGLHDNGGLTQTIALLAGSPAVNAGAPDAPSKDQRGFFRNGPPDIGAFEFGGGFFPVTLDNISTRGLVGIGNEVMIGGFIVSGSGNKLVLLRAKGPSLSDSPINLANTLADPTLSLFSGATRIGFNDNWADASNAQSIDPALRPTKGLESAILVSLAPGAYTAIVSGVNGGTGIGLVEVFDLDATVPSKLSNISTRGLVETGDSVMIGGFIIKGPDSDKVVVRAIGPSLASPPFNLTNVLQNPTLSLFDGNGMVFASNDDWRSNQQADIIATGLQPSNDAESAIVTTLTPGNYTAIVRGAGGSTGIALVEVYGLN